MERNLLNRTVTFTNMNVNNTGNTMAIVDPGTTVTFSTDWTSEYTTPSCPGCITQYYIGVKDQVIDCMYSGGTSYNVSGDGSFSFVAPTEPGVYPVQVG